MRRLLLAIGLTSICTAAALSACSSGDDSTGTNPADGGSDTGVQSDTFKPIDSGAKDSGASCQTCSNFLLIGPQGTACTDNGPPSSETLINQFFLECMCNVDGGGCYTRCGTSCTEFTNPTDDCVACFTSVCSAQVAACEADGDGGLPIPDDAGDGGDGGDGG